MRTFHLHPITLVILVAVLAMGVIGLFVAGPIVLITAVWNVIIPSHTSLPPINPWQGGLLYLAGTMLLYLTGLIDVKFEAEKLE